RSPRGPVGGHERAGRDTPAGRPHEQDEGAHTVVSNQQRRDAAKRKLQRQNERRSQRAKNLRQRLMIVGAVAAVLVIVGAVYLFSGGDSPSGDAANVDAAAGGTSADASDATSASTAPATDTDTPAGACSYPESGTA